MPRYRKNPATGRYARSQATGRYFLSDGTSTQPCCCGCIPADCDPGFSNSTFRSIGVYPTGIAGRYLIDPADSGKVFAVDGYYRRLYCGGRKATNDPGASSSSSGPSAVKLLKPVTPQPTCDACIEFFQTGDDDSRITRDLLIPRPNITNLVDLIGSMCSIDLAFAVRNGFLFNPPVDISALPTPQLPIMQWGYGVFDNIGPDAVYGQTLVTGVEFTIHLPQTATSAGGSALAGLNVVAGIRLNADTNKWILLLRIMVMGALPSAGGAFSANAYHLAFRYTADFDPTHPAWPTSLELDTSWFVTGFGKNDMHNPDGSPLSPADVFDTDTLGTTATLSWSWTCTPASVPVEMACGPSGDQESSSGDDSSSDTTSSDETSTSGLTTTSSSGETTTSTTSTTSSEPPDTSSGGGGSHGGGGDSSEHTGDSSGGTPPGTSTGGGSTPGETSTETSGDEGSGDSSASPCDVPTPVMYVPFDETTGSTAHDVIGGNDLTAFGNYAWVAGKRHNAISLDNSADNTGLIGSDAALPVGNAPRSFSVWINPVAPYGYAHMIFKHGSQNADEAVLMYIDGSRGNVLVFATWLNDTDIVTIPAGQWTNIIATYDGTNWKIYVDGVLEATLALTTSTVSEGHIRFGFQENTTTTYTGLIDEFAAWDVELTSEQAAAIAAGCDLGGGGSSAGSTGGESSDSTTPPASSSEDIVTVFALPGDMDDSGAAGLSFGKYDNELDDATTYTELPTSSGTAYDPSVSGNRPQLGVKPDDATKLMILPGDVNLASAVIRWVPTLSGSITISGHVDKITSGSTLFKIRQGPGAVLYSAHVTGQDYNVTTTVASGSSYIDFIVNADGSGTLDAVTLTILVTTDASNILP